MEVEMEMKHEELTAAERSYLEHADRAQAQGQTLAEYCRQTGLSPHVLYSARRQLKAKGILGQAPKRQRVPRKSGQFITVSVGEPARPGALMCRLRHPSGWVMECASWPEPSWLKGLTGEQA
jgi:hypothetical protein